MLVNRCFLCCEPLLGEFPMFSSGDMGEEKITFVRWLDPKKGERKDTEGNLLKVKVFNLEKKKRMAGNINHC